MTEKAIMIARQEMIQTIWQEQPQFSYEEAAQIANQILSQIDWNNSALMHKGISWITRFYLNNQVKVV